MPMPGRNALLFGSDEEPGAARRLVAGSLSADLEDGNLRAIRFAGVEIIRAVSFLVRDPRWATYGADLADMEIAEHADRFSVSYTAQVRDGEARLAYAARIDGHADGTLQFRCDVHAPTDFETCRTGFVVLHPASVAGRSVTVEHVDGRIVEGVFPRLIDPVQPLFDLRALTHAPAPGISVTCRMEGDAFEMEDQRNWSDASFKTYVRPLSRPWPYVIPQGARETQSVTLRVTGTATRPIAAEETPPIRISAGAAIGRMPAISLGCTAEEARAALPFAPTLAKARVASLVCRFDLGQQHGTAELGCYGELARAMGTGLELQIVVRALTDVAAELRSVSALVQQAGLVLDRIAVSPAPDLKSVTPGQPWPACPPLEAVYEAARAAFPNVPLAGGTFAFFTELNRKRPPLANLNAVTFSTSPLVHAADDRSVMESLEAIPAIAASAHAIAEGKPLLIGPSAIGFRDNPYGPAPLANPAKARLPMSGEDPRQRGLFNAAWTLGYIAGFAIGGAARIAVAAPAGPHGVLDAAGVFPVFHVIRGCAGLRDGELREATPSASAPVAALLVSLPDREELWLANLGAETLRLELPTVFHRAALYRLDAAALGAPAVATLGDTDALHGPAPERAEGAVTLDAYAVLRCVRSV